jgi:GntR family transcriptional regulator of vanillate catabolism
MKSPEEASNTALAVVRLRDMILRGAFQPGERISETPLVTALRISRTPIRLALERLAHEGLIEPYPTGGFIVRRFTVEDVWHAIETRGVLEGMAARLAAETLKDDKELNVMRALQKQMDALKKPSEHTLPTYLEINDAFHAEIIRLSGSSILRLMLDKLFCLPFASPTALVGSPLSLPEVDPTFVTGSQHHHLLIEAISKGHGTFAESLAREHSRLTRYHLELAMGDKAVLAKLPGGPLIDFSTATGT